MKIDSDMLYGPCPCGSGKKFKFCCWQKCRDSINPDMTRAEIVQTVRCEAAGVYNRTDVPEADDYASKGRKAYFKDGDSAKARTLFHKARTLDPKMWGIWNNEAICAYEMGDVEEAYEIQRKGIEACPFPNTFGLAAMAIFAHVLGRDGEAVELIEKALADKRPLSRDVVVEVCMALALFRRHRDIVDYAVGSMMDDDDHVAFFKGTALANLGERSKARSAFEIAMESPSYGPISEYYLVLINDNTHPRSAYGDWPYFWKRAFHPAIWFDDDLKSGRDPFARFPNAAADAIEILVSEESRTPAEMLKLLEGRTEGRLGKLREALAKLAISDVMGNVVDNQDGVDEEMPEGVTAEEDEESKFFSRPKWRMEYEPRKDGTPEEDAKAIIKGLVRPYAERYSSLADHEDGEDFEIAFIQTRYRTGENISESPGVKLGKCSQFWDILYANLKEFFTYFSDSAYTCEVRFDQACGGPILTLSDDGGLVEAFMVSIPDYFSEEKKQQV